MTLLNNTMCIEKHCFVTYNRESVFHFKILNADIFWNDVFQQFAQTRNVPLIIAQFIQWNSYTFIFGYMKYFTEWFIGRFNSYVFVKNKHGLLNGRKNGLVISI